MNGPLRDACTLCCAMWCLLATSTVPQLASAGQQPEPADVVLTGGRIFTADASAPWAEAIEIRGARIVAVGTNAEIARLATARTRRIELAGRTVVPGFEDAHDHVGLSGIGGTRVVMDPSPTPDPPLASVLDSLVAATRRAQPATWISVTVGAQVFDDPRATRRVLDSIAPRHAVWLSGSSGHGAVLNTPALRGAGLFGVPDPVGGWQTRDAAGVSTGRIDEYALYGASRRLALLRQQDNGSALAAAFQRADESGLRLGITTVQDMATGYDLAALRRMVKRGGGTRARHRVVPFPLTDTRATRSSDWRTTAADSVLTSRIEVSGVKWILDGTPIERLALMRQPYSDRPGWHGRANFPFDTLRALLREALARRQQPILHAVGDSTIALVIAAMRAEAPDSSWRALRPRLEHADALGRDQIAAIRSLGIVVVQNPAHLAIPAVKNARWGPERLGRMDLMRTLIDSGVPLAIGGDGLREPGVNIMLATLHPDVPAEAITREEAVVAYTRGAAYAGFAERQRGMLAAGMLADLAVLSQDIFTIAPDALPATVSVLTMVGGTILHDALSASGGRSSRR